MQGIVWLAVGFTGQALFSIRFIVQWWCSERKKRSVIPLAFWYFSLAGGVTLLAYAIYRQDPVFIAGQAGGPPLNPGRRRCHRCLLIRKRDRRHGLARDAVNTSLWA